LEDDDPTIGSERHCSGGDEMSSPGQNHAKYENQVVGKWYYEMIGVELVKKVESGHHSQNFLTLEQTFHVK